jgi:hypothetical protein
MSGTAATSLHTPATAVSGTFVKDIVIAAAAILIACTIGYLGIVLYRSPRG